MENGNTFHYHGGMDMNRVGKLLEIARNEKGITQVDLARDLEIDEKSVRNWEMGKVPKQWVKLSTLCRKLDISADHLLTVGKSALPSNNPKPVNTNTLTEEERVILEKYRRLSDDDQTFVDGLVQKLLQANTPRIIGEEE